jgi:hypothetical protein
VPDVVGECLARRKRIQERIGITTGNKGGNETDGMSQFLALCWRCPCVRSREHRSEKSAQGRER